MTTASPAESTTTSPSAGVTSPSESEHSGHSTDPSDIPTDGESPPSEGPDIPTEGPGGNDDLTAGHDAPLVVPKPPVIEAPQRDVQAALNAPPVLVDVVNPPPPPPTAPRVDIYQQVNTVIQNNTNVVVNNTVVANSLNVTYTSSHEAEFINPFGEDFRVHYYYGGSYREIWVPIGGRIVIPVPVIGIYPFTAVSAHHVWAGDFCGGSYIAPAGWVGPPPPTWRPPPPPVVYTNRTVRVVSANRVVRVASVKVAGRDETRPVGQRDTYMVNDTTLAWGETKPDGSIDIAATQTLPGVGPIDNGGSLIDTAPLAHEEKDHSTMWMLGGGLAVLLAAVVGVFGWRWKRLKPAHGDVADTAPIAWSKEK